MEHTSALDRVFRRGYVLIFAFIFILHVGLSVLPAALMAKGMTGPADLLYNYYRLLCHQYPSRCFFLYGPQSYYPLTPDGSGQMAFAEAAGADADRGMDRSFYGNPRMGYKMAVCERDTAIYCGMALFCLLFLLSGFRIQAPGLLLPALIGGLPIAADGVTQLLGNAFPGIFPFRESSPLLRTVTGALFGICLCWYLIPRLEQALQYRERADRTEME